MLRTSSSPAPVPAPTSTPAGVATHRDPVRAGDDGRPVAATRVLLASHSPVLLAGMHALLRDQRLEVVAAVHSYSRLRRAMHASAADVLLVAPPDEVGDPLRAELRGAGPRTVLLLWDAALKIHGAALEHDTGSTCLPLTATGEEIATALRGHAVRAGGNPIATELVLVGEGGRLTPREQEVLRCLARGLRNREIGVELGLAEETVKGHLKRIFRKLQVSSRTEAIATYLARTT